MVDEAANYLANAMQKELSHFIVGPAAPVVGRIRNQYLMEFLIKLPLDNKQLIQYKKIIRDHFNLMLTEKRFKSVVMIADVDAV